jgi:hypothetical protein
VRVHDLKHTFGGRLRAAGVSEETRKVLLGHKNGDLTTHYSAAELAELITAVNKIDRSPENTRDYALARCGMNEKSRSRENGLGSAASNSLKKLARPERFELPTPWFVGRDSGATS